MSHVLTFNFYSAPLPSNFCTPSKITSKFTRWLLSWLINFIDTVQISQFQMHSNVENHSVLHLSQLLKALIKLVTDKNYCDSCKCHMMMTMKVVGVCGNNWNLFIWSNKIFDSSFLYMIRKSFHKINRRVLQRTLKIFQK